MAWTRQRLQGACAVVFLLWSAGWYKTEALQSGAPEAACVHMTPGHSEAKQVSDPPYTITPSATSYSAGAEITVTITGKNGEKIKGILLQARREDTNIDPKEPIGTFESGVTGSRIACNNPTLYPLGNAVTHQNGANGYDSFQFKWTAPSSLEGHLMFKATIAQEKGTYWQDVRSVRVSDPTAGDIVTVPPTEQDTTTDNTHVSVAECGKTKGCIRSTSGCSTDCDFLGTWKDEGSFVTFELTRKGSGWVALVLSRDQRMGMDSVMECLRSQSGKMLVSQSYNTGRSNGEIASPHDEGISDVRVGYVDGQQVCRFKRRKLTANRTDRIFDMTSEKYFYILARGETFDDPSDVSKPIKKTKHSVIPSVSGSSISNADNLDEVSSPSFTLIKAHGSLMIIAWIITGSIGILTARHYKTQWLGSKWCGFDIWFAIHRPAMIITLLLTIIAFIIIFVYISGWSDLRSVHPAILRAHPILGIIITILAIANPVMAIFRCHPGTEHRPIFNWAHWAVGTAARIMAIIAIFLGIDLLNRRMLTPSNTLLWIMVGFTIFYVLIEIILELHKCVSKKNVANDSMEMKARGEHGATMSGITQVGGTFRFMLYIIYVIGAFAFGIAMIIVIGLA